MFYNEAQFTQTSIIGRWRHRLTSASADRTSRILWNGAVAQLGERVVRNDEVSGSIPLGSTRKSARVSDRAEGPAFGSGKVPGNTGGLPSCAVVACRKCKARFHGKARAAENPKSGAKRDNHRKRCHGFVHRWGSKTGRRERAWGSTRAAHSIGSAWPLLAVRYNEIEQTVVITTTPMRLSTRPSPFIRSIGM